MTQYTPDPARAVLRELLAAIEDVPCTLTDARTLAGARLVLAMNAARNVLQPRTPPASARVVPEEEC